MKYCATFKNRKRRTRRKKWPIVEMMATHGESRENVIPASETLGDMRCMQGSLGWKD